MAWLLGDRFFFTNYPGHICHEPVFHYPAEEDFGNEIGFS